MRMRSKRTFPAYEATIPEVYRDELKRSFPPIERLDNKFKPSCEESEDKSSEEDEEEGDL
jgi:hypothetical protein